MSTGTSLTKAIEYQLSNRVQSGDRAAAFELAEYLGGVIGSLVKDFTRYNLDREDLTSEAYLAAVQAAARFNPGIGAWFVYARAAMTTALKEYARINGFAATMPLAVFDGRGSAVTTTAADAFRSAPSVEQLTMSEGDGAVHEPAGEPSFVEERLAIDEAIAKLPTQMRAAVVLLDYGFTVAETARAMGITADAASAAKNRGIAKMRKLLDESK